MKRREFLATMAALPAVRATVPRKRIAALCSTYHVRSHADNIITRFIEGYWINNIYYEPPLEIVSLWMDQVHPADIGHKLAVGYGFPVVNSIPEALTLGSGRLA